MGIPKIPRASARLVREASRSIPAAVDRSIAVVSTLQRHERAPRKLMTAAAANPFLKCKCDARSA